MGLGLGFGLALGLGFGLALGLGLGLGLANRLHRPKSRSTGSGPMPGSLRTCRLPGCGSALKKPSVNICCAQASHTRATRRRRSMPGYG